MAANIPDLVKKACTHLSKALSVDDQSQMAYHIRSAFQFLTIIEQTQLIQSSDQRGLNHISKSMEFDTDTQTATEAVVTAVGAVKNTEISELEPLTNATDPDALDSFVESTASGTMTFYWGEFEVEVNPSGTVTLSTYIGHPSTRNKQDASNILVLSTDDDEVCKNLLAPVSPQDNVLGVLYSRSVTEWLCRWRPDYGDPPGSVGAIMVGDYTRSSSSSRISGAQPFSITTVPDKTDFQKQLVTIQEQLSTWGDHGTQTIICFDSLSDLLHHVDVELVIRFLQSLTHDIRLAEARAHYHLDPSRHGDETIDKITPLFDIVLENGYEI